MPPKHGVGRSNRLGDANIFKKKPGAKCIWFLFYAERRAFDLSQFGESVDENNLFQIKSCYNNSVKN